MTRSRAVLIVAVLVAACDQLVTKPLHYSAVEVRTERRDGRAVASVPIVLFTGPRPMAYDTTDTLGWVRFDRVPEGLAYGVYARKPDGYEFPEKLLGGPPSDFVTGLTVPRDSTVKVTFRLLKVGAGAVVVRAVDQSGTPFNGLDVELYEYAGLRRHGKTSTDGGVVFDGVPFGVYGVRALRPPGYRDLGESEWVWNDDLMIEEGATANGTLIFKRCQGNINVSLVDPVHGGAPGILTYLFIWSGVLDSAKTGTDGKVSYPNLECLDYGVRAVGTRDWLVTPGRGSEFVDGIVVHRGTTLNVAPTIRYNDCRGAVRVIARDSSGTFVPGTTVTLYMGGGVEPTITRVTPDGIQTFDNLTCGPPERGVRVTPPAGFTVDRGPGSEWRDALMVRTGVTLEVPFTLNNLATCRGAIRVSVTDRTGAPVPGASIVMYMGGGTEGPVTRIATDGTLTFGNLTCGPPERGVRITPPTGWTVAPGAGTEWIDALLVKKGITLDVRFTLTRAAP